MVFNILQRTSKELLITRSIGICLFIQSLISLPLWIGNGGLFPMVPVFDTFSMNFSPFVQLIIGIIYFGFLGALILAPGKYLNKIIIGFIVVLLLMIFQDVNRLQVWNYLYVFIFSTILFCSYFQDKDILIYLRYILAGVYIWSGLHKFNVHYLEVFQWMVSEWSFISDLPQLEFVSKLSAIFEVLIGIFLLTKKYDKIVFFTVIFLHSFILCSLISLKWNTVVYIWNIEMIFLVYLCLFISQDKKYVFRSKITYFIAFFIGFLPSLFLWDMIPGCFSFCMYSGRDISGTVLFHSKDVSIFPKSLNIPVELSQGKEPIGIDIDYWCVQINHVPSFADEKVYLKLSKILCSQYSEKKYGGILLKKYPINSLSTDQVYLCE